MPKNVKINVTISKELDEKFRKTVAKRLGFKKGNLQVAIEEAMLLWINTSNTEKNQKMKENKRAISKSEGKTYIDTCITFILL